MTTVAGRPSKRDPGSSKQQLRAMLGLWPSGKINRRSFLSLVSACAAWGAVATPMAGVRAAQHPGDRDVLFWSTVAAVQEHLFPADGNGPGAVDINATDYLRQIFRDPYVEAKEKEFMSAGITWLDGFCVKQHDGHFHDLEDARREQVLMHVASSPAGRDWVALMIYYILEALLTDPVYGGNPGGIGWRWLDHQPGFPRPPVGRRHYEL